MYNIYYETDNGRMPVISIEGSLDSVDDIARIIADVHSLNKISGEKESKKGVVINLSKTDAINEECLKMFKRLQSVYYLEFQNYSIYMEMQLNEYGLIISEPDIE